MVEVLVYAYLHRLDRFYSFLALLLMKRSSVGINLFVAQDECEAISGDEIKPRGQPRRILMDHIGLL